MWPRWFVSILVAGFLVTLGLTIYFAFRYNISSNAQMQVEVVKSLLQLLVVVIIGGGVIGALLKSAEQSRETLRVRATTRLDYLQRLGQIYRAVKAARRVLRAAGLTTRYGNPPTFLITDEQARVYSDQLKGLDDAQLDLERLKVEAESLPEFVGLQQVSAKLETMENYLREILHEFEATHPTLARSVVFKTLEHLDEFTGETKRSFTFSPGPAKGSYRFKAQFSEPYYTAVKIISKGLGN